MICRLQLIQHAAARLYQSLTLRIILHPFFLIYDFTHYVFKTSGARLYFGFMSIALGLAPLITRKTHIINEEKQIVAAGVLQLWTHFSP